jgi:hypothetical protein
MPSFSVLFFGQCFRVVGTQLTSGFGAVRLDVAQKLGGAAFFLKSKLCKLLQRKQSNACNY